MQISAKGFFIIKFQVIKLTKKIKMFALLRALWHSKILSTKNIRCVITNEYT